MAELDATVDSSAALKTLGEKVAAARDLIARLRARNQSLATEIKALKRALDRDDEPLSEGAAPAAPAGTSDAELELLRREREDVRERIGRVLRQLDEL